MRGNRYAADTDNARTGLLKTRQDFHGGALARTVGSEKADDLTAPNRERDVTYGRRASVSFNQVFDLDGQFVRFHVK